MSTVKIGIFQNGNFSVKVSDVKFLILLFSQI